MKWMRRVRQAATKKASQKLLWLGTITAGPVFGTCPVPLTRIEKTTRRIGTSTAIVK